jgi:hypothetical protein
MEDGLDIPECLRRSRSDNSAPWMRNVGPEIPVREIRVQPEDRGPGSVARKLGYPESPADAIARAEIEAGIRREVEVKKAEGLARLARWKAEIAAVKAATRAQHKSEMTN